ncbi:hypothetical protein O181_035313 [Austropuccinia psidii MF-1]|uniref:CAF1B/HIR1 beta-propeller domain-containing protein n=1 Tax=Austropuccinia psidii MF-1 TaxID=1389203 RepID=A0A9Q3D774_9BASI|nr:hypothetical protein [Austropuccinia psidii MF-1]
MKSKVIEIRWHNTKPIYSADFQLTSPSNLKSLLPLKSIKNSSSSNIKLDNLWRLATAGGDNLIMIWLVYPKPNPHDQINQPSTQKPILNHDPIIEYLATLTKHQAVVNVVRFCPKGEMLASAGDDGNVLLWVLSNNPPSSNSSFGESINDKIYDRESWRTRLMLRGPAQCEIYDLAWSPCGDFILTGDTAKTARIWNVTDGSCIKQIAEHTNFVQGVAWDPLGNLIATQSSDRSINIYSLQINRDQTGGATAEVHHIGKNYKIDILNPQTNTWASHQSHHHHHDKDELHNIKMTPSTTNTGLETPTSTSTPPSLTSSLATHQTPRPKLETRTMSNLTNLSDSSQTHLSHQPSASTKVLSIPPTPSTPASTQFNDEPLMQPPTEIPHHNTNNNISSISSHGLSSRTRSRQSSIVSSQTMSPSSLRPIRSPSPIPPLPAIHINEEKRTKSVLLYGDEGASAFFRRLTWSIDGSMLLTPAGRWESRFNDSDHEKRCNGKGKGKESDKATSLESKTNINNKRRKQRTSGFDSQDESDQIGQEELKENPTVFIYGRGSFNTCIGKANGYQPIARLPGHKTSSVAIRFSPVLYQCKKFKTDCPIPTQPVQVELMHGKPMHEIDLNQRDYHLSSLKTSDDELSVFKLPYRMIYAVATHDTVFIYDTQQSSPICLFSNLHFSSFTDLTWSNDGETLILSSSDGYCSAIVFEKDELGIKLNEEDEKKYLPNQIIERSNAINSIEEESVKVNQSIGVNPQKFNPFHEVKIDNGNNGNPTKEIAIKSELLIKQTDNDSKGQIMLNSDSLERKRNDKEDFESSHKKKKRIALTFEGPIKN